jgi:uncharacterized protein GlcG (DUF336 family)
MKLANSLVILSMLVSGFLVTPAIGGDPRIISKESVSAETALAIAQEGLKAGQERGVEVAIVVVDQAGLPLVLLRSDNATEQFVEGATQKAWTALNLKASTKDLFDAVKSSKEDDSMLVFIPKALLLMGGVPLKDGERIVGAVGAAGSPSGLGDDAIARQAAEVFSKGSKKEKE